MKDLPLPYSLSMRSLSWHLTLQWHLPSAAIFVHAMHLEYPTKTQIKHKLKYLPLLHLCFSCYKLLKKATETQEQTFLISAVARLGNKQYVNSTKRIFNKSTLLFLSPFLHLILCFNKTQATYTFWILIPL